ncbi:MAG: zinc ribbon domain-containing protein [Betaproteobacteria bacterium]|nr:zinc ribbon domain-containing protein [Betaproteobacteria bacterium]NBT09436.1 zinc ribbon domain-containing protein [Betaproteobacteria bacterium]NBU49081.1 zinc ribbon domain-containing protein [Betaproteobacteria bacterium]NBX96413.1 zinc ribbon domain-containing protein [Betaproteobacteria bacterium]
MPIYAYRCAACGHAKDVLQRISDPVLTTCPACSAESFAKQVTAAGFQLKGSGWYVTDFRGGAGGGKGAEPAGSDGGSAAPGAAPAPDSGSGGGTESSGSGGDSGGSAGGSAGSASTGACGTSCACH